MSNIDTSSSMYTTTEDADYDSSFVSNTNATICNTADLCSAWGSSLMSGPIISTSSYTTVDDQPEMSTAAGGADPDRIELGASSSRPVRIFNVDFSQFSGVPVGNIKGGSEVKTLMASAESNMGNSDDEPARTFKRPRLVWTPQLHKRFVDAVAHLGIKNAVPETIVQLMNVDGLTREHEE